MNECCEACDGSGRINDDICRFCDGVGWFEELNQELTSDYHGFDCTCMSCNWCED